MDAKLIQANVPRSIQKKIWNHPATPLNDPHQNWNSKRTKLLNTVHKQINKKAHPPTIHISFDFHQSKCFLFIFRRVVKEKLFHLRRGRIDRYSLQIQWISGKLTGSDWWIFCQYPALLYFSFCTLSHSHSLSFFGKDESKSTFREFSKQRFFNLLSSLSVLRKMKSPIGIFHHVNIIDDELPMEYIHLREPHNNHNSY